MLSAFICWEAKSRKEDFIQRENEHVDAPLKRCEKMAKFRILVSILFLGMNIYITPFSDAFFTMVIISSIIFIVEYSFMNWYYFSEEEYYLKRIVFATVWITATFLQAYQSRRVLVQFFVTQTEAEKTSQTLTQILDNLPDAVLMFESDT